MSERWLPVPDWPMYEVSDFGRARRVRGRGCREDRLLSLSLSGKGYGKCGLSDRGRTKTAMVHRLVLLAFAGPPPTSRHEVAHGDGVKTNCRLDNLSWKLPKENAMDKWLHGTQPTKHSAEKVAMMRCLAANGFSRKAIARGFGMAGGTVSDIVNGKSRVMG